MTADQYREAAQAAHAADDDVQVDADAAVVEVDEGAWVAAWVWVPSDQNTPA